MATPAHLLIQDQNLNILYSGTTPGGKTTTKADKRGGLGGRKALNDISNSRKPSVLHSVKKDHSVNVLSIEKDPCSMKTKLAKAPDNGKFGGRKALSDLTNSVKPPSKQVPGLGRKLNAVAGENVSSFVMEERFLHNHQECITAQMQAVGMDYFLKSVGLSNDVDLQPSSDSRRALRALPLYSKKDEINIKHLEMEEMPEHLVEDQVLQCIKSELSGYSSPSCPSPRSPKAPYMRWEEDDISDLTVIETPKPV